MPIQVNAVAGLANTVQQTPIHGEAKQKLKVDQAKPQSVFEAMEIMEGLSEISRRARWDGDCFTEE